MFQALTGNPRATCTGNWYEVYPTLENRAAPHYFKFELLPMDSQECAHLVENLKTDDERMVIKTDYRHGFACDTFVAAFGNLYKIDRYTRERVMPRGVSVPRISYTLYLVKLASNPLEL